MSSEKEKLITAEELREALHYEPETGYFIWKKRQGEDRFTKRWNTRYADKRAGNINGCGYRHIAFKGKRYLEHRLAWLWMCGVWPSKDIDHKDGNRSNNQWNNIRLATQAQNNANSIRSPNHSAGLKGVYAHRGRFGAQITINYKNHHLGIFDTPEDAHAAYMRASRKIHGEFARAE